MQISGYNIDLEKAVKIIKKKGYKTVVIQIPEGLKRNIFKIVESLKKETNATIMTSADPCFGACDIANNELKNLDVEFVVHIGHTPIPVIDNLWIPTIFINALSNKDIAKTVNKSLPFLEGTRVGIVTTAQHIHNLDIAENILRKNDFKPIISGGSNRIFKNGQILGCDFSSGIKILDKVDCFLFIGSGTFHPIGLLLSSKKPVIAADPYTNTIKKKELDDLKDVILRQRYGAIVNSKNARIFGILISTKRGQQRMDLVYKIQKMIEAFNKEYIIITMNNSSPVSLQGFGNIDCYVSTACPRIAIDDYLQYKIPIITPIELEIVLGKKKWEDYRFDQID